MMNIFRLFSGMRRSAEHLPPLHLLVDDRNIVLAVHKEQSVIALLEECMQNTIIANSVRARFLLGMAPDELIGWSWAIASKKFYRTKKSILTDKVRGRAKLARAKLDAIVRLIFLVALMRAKLTSAFPHQEHVYALKRADAERFKGGGYNDKILLEHPFVVQYADLSGQSPREAADDILFRAGLSDEVYAKTELLRMRYVRRICAEDSPENLPKIMEECYRDYLTNSYV